MSNSVRRKSSNNFLVQGSILAAASLISRIIGLLYRIPMTNIIGDAGNGYYSNAYNIYNIALIISSYSLPLAVSKLVAAKTAKKQYINVSRLFFAAMTFGFMSGLIMTCIVYFGAEKFANFLFEGTGSVMALRVLSPTILLCAMMGVLRGFFQGKGTMIPTSISQIVEQFVNAIVSIVACYYLMMAHSASADIASYGAAGGTLGTCIGGLFGLLFLIFVYFVNRPIIKKQKRRDYSGEVDAYPDIYKMILLTSLPVILSQTVYQLSGVIDASIFQKILAAKGVAKSVREVNWGIYAGKYLLLTNVPVAIASALGSSMIPAIVKAKAQGYNAEVNSKVGATVKFNMLIAIPSAVGLAVLAPNIIAILFGSSDAASQALASKLLMWGSVCVVFYALSTISNAVLQGVSLMRIPVIHSAIALVIHCIVVALILVIHPGANVYALMVGNILFPLIVSALNWISVKKALKYEQELIKTFLIPACSAAVMGMFAFLVKSVIMKLTHSNIISFTLSFTVAVVIYFVSVLLFRGVTANELLAMPKGASMVRLFKKIKLL